MHVSNTLHRVDPVQNGERLAAVRWARSFIRSTEQREILFDLENARRDILVFNHACKLGLEGIVSKRKGSRYRSGRSPDWVKSKNPNAPAVKREAEIDWGR